MVKRWLSNPKSRLGQPRALTKPMLIQPNDLAAIDRPSRMCVLFGIGCFRTLLTLIRESVFRLARNVVLSISFFLVGYRVVIQRLDS